MDNVDVIFVSFVSKVNTCFLIASVKASGCGWSRRIPGHFTLRKRPQRYKIATIIFIRRTVVTYQDGGPISTQGQSFCSVCDEQMAIGYILSKYVVIIFPVIAIPPIFCIPPTTTGST